MQTISSQEVTRVPADSGATYNVIGELVTFKLTQAETGGAFTVVEMLSQPGGGPPPHTHPSSEAFTILEGEFEFTRIENGAPRSFRAVAGDTVFVPSGAAHTYQAVGETPAKTAIVLIPGDDMEGFFKEAGTLVTDEPAVEQSPPDIPAMIAIAAKHGMFFLPPAES